MTGVMILTSAICEGNNHVSTMEVASCYAAANSLERAANKHLETKCQS